MEITSGWAVIRQQQFRSSILDVAKGMRDTER
jgi:hypothetical protein